MKVLILLITVLFSTILYSQDAIDKMAKGTCDCIRSKKLDLSNKDENELIVQMGICIMPEYYKYKNELSKSDQVEVGDSKGFKELGGKVGVRMLNICPEIMLELGKKYLNEDDEIISEDPPKVIDFKVEGQVVEIKKEQFLIIQVKDKNLRNFNFLLLEYFPTASLYTEGKIKKGDTLTVFYQEVELYDSTFNEFRYFKVISGLEKK